MINLDTPRLAMRQIVEADWTLFCRLLQDPKVIELAFDQPSPDDIQTRFDSRLPEWRHDSEHWLCLTIIEKETGKSVGVTGFQVDQNDRSRAEVGYLLLPEYHGNGYGTESLQRLVQFAVEELHLSCLTATVTDGNEASCRVLEKCGFEFSQRIPDAYEIRQQRYDDLIYILTVNKSV
ncbi:GNAT family N-acetyltransferase [Photobacterium alginatilyticum]|uniref:GNAT family N-acetyltransferase n=1 Tax=Photobacterium alginatilyticum TaxID=1775171 RepID=UPI00406897BF